MDGRELVKDMSQIELKKMIQLWGIERTEEQIKYLYRSMPSAKLYLLREYNNILKEK